MGLKKNLVLGTILLSSLFALCINNENVHHNEHDFVEFATDYQQSESFALPTRKAGESSEISHSPMYAQYGVTTEGKYALRFATAIKGNPSKVTYTRAALDEFSLTEESFDVSVAYKGILADGQTKYFDGTNIVNEPTEETKEYYWVCHTILFGSHRYDASNISMSLAIDDQIINKTASLNSLLVGEETSTYVIEAETAHLTKGDGRDLKLCNDGSSGERYVGEFNSNQGANATFYVGAEKDTTVGFTVRINKRLQETVYNDVVEIKVNDEIVTSNEKVPSSGSAETWKTFSDIKVCYLSLKKGSNKISLTNLLPKSNNTSGYNFDNIKLESSAKLCTEYCNECGKCLRSNCEICLDKCSETGNTLRLEAENSTLGNGNKGALKIENNNTVIGNLSENTNASMTFTFNSNQATLAKFIVAPTRRSNRVFFSEAFRIYINNVEYEFNGYIEKSATGANEWKTSFEINLGHINLNSGTNTIKLVVRSNNTLTTPNFDYISLTSAATLSN